MSPTIDDQAAKWRYCCPYGHRGWVKDVNTAWCKHCWSSYTRLFDKRDREWVLVREIKIGYDEEEAEETVP